MATYIFFTPLELIFFIFGAEEIMRDDIIWPRPSNMYLKTLSTVSFFPPKKGVKPDNKICRIHVQDYTVYVEQVLKTFLCVCNCTIRLKMSNLRWRYEQQIVATNMCKQLALQLEEKCRPHYGAFNVFNLI